MNLPSRRNFIQAAAAMPAAATLVRGAGEEHSLKTIGFQTYTVRGVLPQKPLETLQELDRIGYREVELGSGDLPRIWDSLKQTRLKAMSIHFDTSLLVSEKASEFGAMIADAKQHGVEYLVYPYVAPNKRAGLTGMQKLAGTLNQAGERCRTAGVQLCYHNHAFEFEPLEGTTPMAVLMQETHKDLVSLEMDVFWVSVGGNDPVELLRRYAGRIPLMHLKDKATGTPIQYNESVAKTAFKEVGSGTLDFPAILRAATTEGVKHYFVEQDSTPGDPSASLRQSFEYLHGLKY